MKSHIKLGTRGSALALKQAEMTEAALAKAFPDLEVERVVITTTGDRRTDVSLKDVASAEGVIDKGVFIKELEVALESGEIDFAVHSLKDVPTVLEDQFELAGFLERAPVRDCLVSLTDGGIAGLPQGAKVATSSVRRARQLTYLRPDVEVVDIRGNVPTRLQKLVEIDGLDAIMLAEAGLRRLNYDIDSKLSVSGHDVHVECLDPAEFFPAAGQGAVAFETRFGDDEVMSILAAISHYPTALQVQAEREFLRLLDAGCHTPVGVTAELEGEKLHMTARVFSEEVMAAEPRHAQAEGAADQPEQVGAGLFAKLG